MNLPTIMIIIQLAILAINPLFAEKPGDEPALGPLGGRNVYAPHLPWFSFTSEKAAAMPEGVWKLSSGIYYLNEFISFSSKTEKNSGRRYSAEEQDNNTIMDYESTVWELGIDWQLREKFRLSADWSLNFRYGGFMDPVIEWWHKLLGTRNAGREYFDNNRSMWNIERRSAHSFIGRGSIIASGDLNIRSFYTLIQHQRFALALTAAIKLPIGMVKMGFSTGYPDIAGALILDWHPWNRWAFYLTSGIIFPFDGHAKVIYQAIPAVEFRMVRNLSFVLQMNFQTSPINSPRTYIDDKLGKIPLFHLPQMDIKIGIKGRHGRFEWELYVEEDPFTWEGPDILFYFGAGYFFNSAP